MPTRDLAAAFGDGRFDTGSGDDFLIQDDRQEFADVLARVIRKDGRAVFFQLEIHHVFTQSIGGNRNIFDLVAGHDRFVDFFGRGVGGLRGGLSFGHNQGAFGYGRAASFHRLNDHVFGGEGGFGAGLGFLGGVGSH